MLLYMHYNIDPLWNLVLYDTIYADQRLKKSILTNFKKNSSATWKSDLKCCSRILITKMSLLQLAKKLKDILFFLLKQLHGNQAIIITSIP